MKKHFFKRNIRMLKRQYGLPVHFVKAVSEDPDLDTGAKYRTYTYEKVRKALILPQKMIRDFVYDLSYIAAAKNFTTGAYFDSTKSTVIVEGANLSESYGVQDFVVFNEQVWEIKDVARHPQGIILGFSVIALKGRDHERIMAQIL